MSQAFADKLKRRVSRAFSELVDDKDKQPDSGGDASSDEKTTGSGASDNGSTQLEVPDAGASDAKAERRRSSSFMTGLRNVFKRKNSHEKNNTRPAGPDAAKPSKPSSKPAPPPGSPPRPRPPALVEQSSSLSLSQLLESDVDELDTESMDEKKASLYEYYGIMLSPHGANVRRGNKGVHAAGTDAVDISGNGQDDEEQDGSSPSSPSTGRIKKPTILLAPPPPRHMSLHEILNDPSHFDKFMRFVDEATQHGNGCRC